MTSVFFKGEITGLRDFRREAPKKITGFLLRDFRRVAPRKITGENYGISARSAEKTRLREENYGIFGAKRREKITGRKLQDFRREAPKKLRDFCYGIFGAKRRKKLRDFGNLKKTLFR